MHNKVQMYPKVWSRLKHSYKEQQNEFKERQVYAVNLILLYIGFYAKVCQSIQKYFVET